jgi:hypothetical protein
LKNESSVVKKHTYKHTYIQRDRESERESEREREISTKWLREEYRKISC